MTEIGVMVVKVKSIRKFPFNTQLLSEKEVLMFLEFGNRIIESQKGKDFQTNVINAQNEGCDYA
ncbi:hypothetical protein [Cytobacillus luteolus]|nr:hypothetical protein [Cytobacillus luteolus]MBP1940396.1 hypothetical protein [Cytobacillus luteolus]